MVSDERAAIEKQLNQALAKELELEEKLKKVGDGPQAETFKLQLEKVTELAKHLQEKRIEIIRNE